MKTSFFFKKLKSEIDSIDINQITKTEVLFQKVKKKD